MSTDVYSTDWLLPRYGMYALDYADTYPELTAALRRLYLDKLAGVPWVPKDWRASIGTLHGQDGKLLMPAPSNAVDSRGNGVRFLVTDEQRAWWDELVRMARSIQEPFMAKKLAEGRSAMERAYNRADFWTKAHQLATVLAAPVTVAKGLWDRPWLTGTLLWGGLGLLAFLTLRSTFKPKGRP